MKLPPFAYAGPASVAEAVALLAVHEGEARPLRLTAVKRVLDGSVVDAIAIAGAEAADVDPPDDIHAGGACRKKLLMVERALRSASGLE